VFSSANYNPEELQEQQLKTDSEGKPRLIKLLLNGQYQITAGTIDGLVEALADENAPGACNRSVLTAKHSFDLQTPCLSTTFCSHIASSPHPPSSLRNSWHATTSSRLPCRRPTTRKRRTSQKKRRRSTRLLASLTTILLP